MSEFRKKVLEVVGGIEPGKVLSYKQVAQEAGSPGAWRAVGSILRDNHHPAIPCHRVIKSNGEPGGYNGGEIEKEIKLISENARFDKDRNIKYTCLRSLEADSNAANELC